MSLENFRIVFDKPDATYAPGETVTGEVIFDIIEPKNIKELRIKSRGIAETSWSESRNVTNTDGSTSSETTWYGTKEQYFKTSNRILGSETADEQITLQTGQHSYKFSLQLPVDIPSSFEHTYGHVRYAVKAVIDRTWGLNHKVNSALTVSTPSDLKLRRCGINAIDDEIEHQFVSYCCMNWAVYAGLMKINVKGQASKLLPGESIELIISYDRYSTQVHIQEMKLKFVKNMTFHGARKDRQYASKVLNKAKGTGPYGKRGETSLKLIVPSITPINLQHCSIIDVEYALALDIKVSGLHSKITRSYPVDI